MATRIAGPMPLPAPAPLRRWARTLALSIAVWTVIWVFLSTPSYLYFREKGGPLPWPRFAGSLGSYWLTALITPVFLQVVWRAPLERRRWGRRLPLLVAAVIVFAAADVALTLAFRLAVSLFLEDARWFDPLTGAKLLGYFVMNVVTYGEIGAVGHAIHYYREARHKDLRASQLEARLAQAQLDVLKMQLHPHFLFNTLNTISALMHRDPAAADRMVVLLSDLLRQSLRTVSAAVVPLKQELEILEKYLEIERTRFRDRLTVLVDADPETLDAAVPNLILQPLVENAVRHGIAQRSGAGRIEVAARREDGMLAIHVRDDGPGMRAGLEGALRGGVGLANTQARLQQMYGARYRFELHNRPEGGLEVCLYLPFEGSLPLEVALPGELPAGRDRTGLQGTLRPYKRAHLEP